MMERPIEVLTPEKFKEIYTNEKLRNEVAYAHGVCMPGEKEYRKALMYPVSYKVTDAQIKEAKALIEKRSNEVLKENKYNLLFRGMGMEFSPSTPSFVGNHRIRTTFFNAKSNLCFIEVGTNCNNDFMRVDHALINYDQKKGKRLSIEHKTKIHYTYQNVIDLVNKTFGCNFKKMVVDNYSDLHSDTLGVDFALCRSPEE